MCHGDVSVKSPTAIPWRPQAADARLAKGLAFPPGRFSEVVMSALPKLKSTDAKASSVATSSDVAPSGSAGIYIPPPSPTEKATLEQVRASLERSLAQARAGIVEDFDVVQARMRAKYGLRSR